MCHTDVFYVNESTKVNEPVAHAPVLSTAPVPPASDEPGSGVPFAATIYKQHCPKSELKAGRVCSVKPHLPLHVHALSRRYYNAMTALHLCVACLLGLLLVGARAPLACANGREVADDNRMQPRICKTSCDAPNPSSGNRCCNTG